MRSDDVGLDVAGACVFLGTFPVAFGVAGAGVLGMPPVPLGVAGANVLGMPPVALGVAGAGVPAEATADDLAEPAVVENPEARAAGGFRGSGGLAPPFAAFLAAAAFSAAVLAFFLSQAFPCQHLLVSQSCPPAASLRPTIAGRRRFLL